MTPIGSTVINKKLEGFSTDRHCPVCDQTVNWRKFHIEPGMCVACWRKHITREVNVLPRDSRAGRREKKTKEDRMESFLASIPGGNNHS